MEDLHRMLQFDSKILCMHEGLSPELENLDQIREIVRPTEVPNNGLLRDLLWSDPDPNADGWANSDWGIFCTFGADNVTEFLYKNDFDLICRDHQVEEDGYEFFAKQSQVTIFSAPNYGEFDNAGALLSVDKNLLCTFEILKPEDRKAPTSSNSSSSSSTTALKKGSTLTTFPQTSEKPDLDDMIIELDKGANNQDSTSRR